MDLFLLQALTTGGIPGFIDVVFNLDSKSLQEDNLISQMKTSHKKLVFYGDDTWMKLFPGHFARTDGTTSVVLDYTEVQKSIDYISNHKILFFDHSRESESVLICSSTQRDFMSAS